MRSALRLWNLERVSLSDSIPTTQSHRPTLAFPLTAHKPLHRRPAYRGVAYLKNRVDVGRVRSALVGNADRLSAIPTRPNKEVALRILMVPGYMGSGPEHWQRQWERADPAIERVEQEDWARPERSAWVSRLDEYLGDDPHDTILVAHSLGCSTVAAWAAQKNAGSSVAGALLVAPADPIPT